MNASLAFTVVFGQILACRVRVGLDRMKKSSGIERENGDVL